MRRPVLSATGLLVAAALVLAGCGSDDEPASGAASTPQAGDEAFPRTIEHAMGSTEIPERPERVVVLDTGELDAVLSLGLTPVGAVTTAVSDGFLSYLADDASGVEVVGTIAEPDLEAVAALEPDLILSNKVRHEDVYDQLSQIAPTVFAEAVGETWKENFLLDARALGEEDRAQELLDAYEQRAGDVGAELADPAATTVSPLRFVGGTVRAYQPDSFIGSVLADIGLTQLQLDAGRPTFAELGLEQLGDADADVVLYSSYGPADESGEAGAVAGPLWSRLTAVQEGRAFEVEDDVFYTGIGLRAATLQVERLAELLDR